MVDDGHDPSKTSAETFRVYFEKSLVKNEHTGIRHGSLDQHKNKCDHVRIVLDDGCLVICLFLEGEAHNLVEILNRLKAGLPVIISKNTSASGNMLMWEICNLLGYIIFLISIREKRWL